MMRALTLNYCAGSRIRWGSIAFCIAMFLCLGYLVDRYVALDHKQSMLHAQSGKLQKALKNATDGKLTPAAITGADPEIAFANKTINRLTQPWELLFQAVEGAQFEHVALLSIQPELEGQSLTLTAEAKDLPAMLEYVKRLANAPLLANVRLVSHQVQQQDPQKPIRFVVLADW